VQLARRFAHMKKKLILVAALGLLSAFAFAQEESADAAQPKFDFSASISLGTDVLPSGGESEAWTRLGFQPDISFGKFGLGLDLSLRFKLYPTNDQAIEVYGGDWIPNFEGNGKTFFDVYLPKFLYIRYGVKGEDSLFAKLGSIDDLSLGDGFIMSEYSNMRFMPETRIFGLDLGLDGQLFNFPYVGFELLTGNLASFDVMGGRVYGRPLVDTAIPILKGLQVGATAVVDRDPYRYSAESGASPLAVYGGDLYLPILTDKVFPLAAFSDLAFESANKSMGAMVGAGGRLISIITYGAQLRLLEDGFIPSYFDANYDIYRADKYDYMQEATDGTFYAGWYGSLGLSLLEDKIVFRTSLDGPFRLAPVGYSTSQTDYPHAKAILRFGKGLIGGFFADASYEKYFIGRQSSFFPDLVDPTDAVIGMALNYQTGASVITLNYDAKWDAGTASFVVTSSLEASMQL
jgi:hypothetical protein